MFRPGEMQTLVIVRLVKPGARLAEPETPEGPTILLPRRYVPAEAREGQLLDVFVHFDSDDRPVATTLHPHLLAGQLALLSVKEVTEIGAFLDWGIGKDLFLPFGEQIGRPQPGDEVFVGLRTDRQGRLSATMKIEPLLSRDSPHMPGDRVSGRAWCRRRDLGVFVAVEDRYAALLPDGEMEGRPPRPGERFSVRVSRRLADGRLELSQRRPRDERMDADADTILARLESAGGELPLHDASAPEEIRARLGISKAAFKRALGRLLKAGKVETTEQGIRRQ